MHAGVLASVLTPDRPAQSRVGTVRASEEHGHAPRCPWRRWRPWSRAHWACSPPQCRSPPARGSQRLLWTQCQQLRRRCSSHRRSERLPSPARTAEMLPWGHTILDLQSWAANTVCKHCEQWLSLQSAPGSDTLAAEAVDPPAVAQLHATPQLSKSTLRSLCGGGYVSGQLVLRMGGQIEVAKGLAHTVRTVSGRSV